MAWRQSVIALLLPKTFNANQRKLQPALEGGVAKAAVRREASKGSNGLKAGDIAIATSSI